MHLYRSAKRTDPKLTAIHDITKNMLSDDGKLKRLLASVLEGLSIRVLRMLGEWSMWDRCVVVVNASALVPDPGSLPWPVGPQCTPR